MCKHACAGHGIKPRQKYTVAGAGGAPVAGLLQPRTMAHAGQGEPEGHRPQALGPGTAYHDMHTAAVFCYIGGLNLFQQA